MGEPAPKIDADLPSEIADAMEAAGLSPRLATLMATIDEFRRMKAAIAKAEGATEAEKAFPLKPLLPLNVSYRVGLEAAERGLLRAFKNGGRWFCTKREMVRWLAATGRSGL